MIRPRPIKSYAIGIYDGPHATPKESSEGAVFLGIKNIGSDGRLDFSEIRHVSEEELPRWTRRVFPQAGDVVFTYEATLHRYAVIPEGFRGCLGRRVGLVRPDPKQVDSRYLLYYFLSDRWRRVVESQVISGATVDRIPLEKLPDFPVSLHSLREQHRIAETLSAYDVLIENNQRRMKLLEEAARLLYQEWFVRLKFPGHEHTPIVNGVPQGWSRRELKDVAAVNAETLSGSFDREIEYVDISSVIPGEITGTAKYDFRDAPSRARRIVRHGDIIWSCVRPNRRSYAMIWNPADNLIVSTGFAVITPISVPSAFIYFSTTTDAYVKRLENLARGAAYPAVLSSDFEESELLAPSTTLLRTFCDVTTPIFSQLHNLKLQNQKLRAARDLLLPRLMSGEIAV